MALIEEWKRKDQLRNSPRWDDRDNFGQMSRGIDRLGMGNNDNDGDYDDDGDQTEEETDIPMFSVQKLDWRPSKEQGSLVALSVGSDVLLIGTANNYVIRWNVGTDKFDDIQVSKREDKIHKVFMDPGGNHALIGMKSGHVYYLHSRKKKAYQCTKIKNVVIESVAWNSSHGNEGSTKNILIGTKKGYIYESLIEDRDKYFKRVHDLNTNDSEPSPVSGLRIEIFPGQADDGSTKYFVLAATPTRFYQFIGGPTFEEMFKKYATDYTHMSWLEFPGDLDNSELRFFSKYQGKSKYTASETCAWLTGAGVYYGNLVFGSQDQPGDRVVDDGKLLAYPPEYNAAQPPLSLILTEFHFLILNKNRLSAINRLNKETVWYEDFAQNQNYGVMKGLSPDSRKNTVWLYSNKYVFEVEIDSEDRNVWKLYLQDGKFEDAEKYCSTQYQKEQVLNKQADYYFDQESYELAAQYYAKTQRSFEEVTLKFVDTGITNIGIGNMDDSSAVRAGINARNALKKYLQCKLETLGEGERMQHAVICTWLTEIFLDNVNNLSNSGTESENELNEFRNFLDNYSDCLNRETTFELISSHGRVDELLYYAGIESNLELILNHHIQHGGFKKVLSILRKHDEKEKIFDLFYKFAPPLLQHLPSETVDMLISVRLDPAKLIPGLMRYVATTEKQRRMDEERKSSRKKPMIRNNEAIRYLEHCIKIGNKDPAIHNYLVSLYVKQQDEEKLLYFIESHQNHPYYDAKYALRLCHQEGKKRACVKIYTQMGLYEEAVQLALQKDIQPAKDVVARAKEDTAPHVDHDQQKRLWLIIARHIIDNENNISKAMTILKECDSMLKLEDILPYFSDFVTIGQFKDEICKSLENYNKEIEKLKADMDEYTEAASLIRKDIYELRNRSGYVTANQKCDVCRQPVLTRQFFLFPCTHVFHVDCVTEEVKKYLDKHPRIKQKKLGVMDDLSMGMGGEHEEVKLHDAQNHELMRALEKIAAEECIFCGNIMIDSVHEPFISLPEEELLLKSWSIE